MKSQIRYNRPISFAVLQVFLALMSGDDITFDDFEELTNFKNTTYREVMKIINEMFEDLHIVPKLMVLKTVVSTNKTEYFTYRYSLSSHDDYRYDFPNDIEEEKLITYLPVLAYLRLRAKKYVSWDILSKYYPNFTRHTFSDFLVGFKNVIGEELYKNDIQSYIIEDID